VSWPDAPAVHHAGDALVFDTADELLAVCVPFLQAGLRAGDAVVLSCAAARAALLADAVDRDAGLTILPPPQPWRRPIAAMQEYQDLIEAEVAAGRRVRVLADSDFGPVPTDWSEWARFEAACHHARRSDPVRSICLLHRPETPPDVIAAAERLHPFHYDRGVRTRSSAYQAPGDNIRQDAYVSRDPLTDLPPTLAADDLAPSDLATLRQEVTAHLGRLRLPAWRVHEFTVAVSETVANAIRHGRPPVRMALWSTPGRVLCTVTDLGAGFDYPLSSYLHLDPDRTGLGVFLARQLADQVNICWTPEAFTVRLALILS
jgi:anti-sigma regulatory factor (Ser/Thr protein kinase)